MQVLEARSLVCAWSVAAHEERAQHVVWNERRLLSCGADCAVKLWNPDRPCECAVL